MPVSAEAPVAAIAPQFNAANGQGELIAHVARAHVLDPCDGAFDVFATHSEYWELAKAVMEPLIRDRERLAAGECQSGRIQLIDDQPRQLLGGTRLHARRNFFRENFEEEFGHGPDDGGKRAEAVPP